MNPEQVRPRRPAGIWIVAGAALLGVFLACAALRGSTNTAIVDTDAARHAMNGAFVYDMLRSGQWRHPVWYAEWYYARMPAISIPYHPPLFPAFEALVFAAAGVSVPAARAAVALCVGVTAFLLVLLIVRTHASPPIAFGATLLLLALPLSRRLAGDVMLEFPAMLCTVLALMTFVRVTESALARGVLVYGLFAGMAIWTKQCVFLCLTPVIYVMLARAWLWFRSRRFWICVGMPVAGAAALGAISWSQGWSGQNQTWASYDPMRQLLFNLKYYAQVSAEQPAGVALLVVLAGYAIATARRRSRLAAARDLIYWAWLLSVLAVLIAAPAYSGRYLFFAYPPALVLLFRAAESLMPAIRGLRMLLPAAAGLYAVFAITTPADFLRGPEQAALWVSQRNLSRVMYCGLTDGNFIFSLRSLQEPAETMVIRGEKLPPAWFRKEGLLTLARRYGIDALILEKTAAAQPWDEVFDSVTPDYEVAMTSSQPRMQGRLKVILLEGSPASGAGISVPIDIMGREIEVQGESKIR